MESAVLLSRAGPMAFSAQLAEGAWNGRAEREPASRLDGFKRQQAKDGGLRPVIFGPQAVAGREFSFVAAGGSISCAGDGENQRELFEAEGGIFVS
jgi:hypothetical protein